MLELRDILDYALVLLEPPPPEQEGFVGEEAAGPESSGPNGDDPQVLNVSSIFSISCYVVVFAICFAWYAAVLIFLAFGARERGDGGRGEGRVG